MKIAVLLAAYNGERYLREQIESLLNQTVKEFDLYIHDDHSTDGTFEIAQEFAAKHGNIRVTRAEHNSGSAEKAFFELVSAVQGYDYYFLCDQDDVWFSDKIEVSLAAMQDDVPMLLHTDLTVTDGVLNVIAQSYRKHMAADFRRVALNNLVVQNIATGCTCVYNEKLRELIRVPEFCVMHDWWLAIIASAFGRLWHIERQTMFYRQHEDNRVGASDVKSLGFKIHNLLHNEKIRAALAGSYKQAAEFARLYDDMLYERQRAVVCGYAATAGKRKLGRAANVIKLRTMKTGASRKIAQILYI
jgi:Glycosyltransferases involved in cell wall biogenesis